MKYKGNVLVGSADPQTSVADAEILTYPSVDAFAIHVADDCHVSTNHAPYVFLPAGSIWTTDGAMNTVSARIREDGARFSWIGRAYMQTEVPDR